MPSDPAGSEWFFDNLEREVCRQLSVAKPGPLAGLVNSSGFCRSAAGKLRKFRPDTSRCELLKTKLEPTHVGCYLYWVEAIQDD